MKHLRSILILLAGAAALFAFGLNYNASKSNTGNVIVTPEFVTSAQAAAILADLEKAGGTPTEAVVRQALKKNGVDSIKIQKIVTGMTASGGSKGYGIMLLASPGDEAAAKATMGRAGAAK